MTLIGYTNDLHNFLMAEIEVNESDYVPIKKPYIMKHKNVK
jgi:hypothetical protein